MKLRLMIVTPRLSGGGAERVAANLANYWADKGWDIYLVTFTPPGPNEYPLYRHVQRLWLDHSTCSTGEPSSIAIQIQRVAQLRSYIKTYRPQVVVGIMEAANVVVALATWGTRNTLSIGTVHNYRSLERIGKAQEIVAKYAYGWLDCVVALTPQMQEYILQYTKVRVVQVIPNGIILPLPDIPPQLPPYRFLPQDGKLLLCVGRLEVQKGHDLLLQSFERVAGDHPDWTLVILGEGDWRKHLEGLVQRYGLEQRVKMPGRAGNLTEWYSRADLFVLSSRWEGFPLALIEALAHGVPVVSFDCAYGPREVIRHNVDGLLVPAEDTEALGEALDYLMSDADLRHRFSQRAIEARERFSMERIASLWEQMFAEMLERKRIQL
jgi:glycosyltransferase involved in cell wall biosynthesis